MTIYIYIYHIYVYICIYIYIYTYVIYAYAPWQHQYSPRKCKLINLVAISIQMQLMNAHTCPVVISIQSYQK